MRWLLALVLAVGCGAKFKPVEAQHLDAKALAVGSATPAVTMTTSSNGAVALRELFAGHAQTIVVFYRGFF